VKRELLDDLNPKEKELVTISQRQLLQVCKGGMKGALSQRLDYLAKCFNISSKRNLDRFFKYFGISNW
jgi:hypothetical protein